MLSFAFAWCFGHARGSCLIRKKKTWRAQPARNPLEGYYKGYRYFGSMEHRRTFSRSAPSFYVKLVGAAVLLLTRTAESTQRSRNPWYCIDRHGIAACYGNTQCCTETDVHGHAHALMPIGSSSRARDTQVEPRDEYVSRAVRHGQARVREATAPEDARPCRRAHHQRGLDALGASWVGANTSLGPEAVPPPRKSTPLVERGTMTVRAWPSWCA